MCNFYVVGSTEQFFVSDFVMEIAYIIVRISLKGPLSLATESFVDFLTLAVPLFWNVFETMEIEDFILNYSKPNTPSNSKVLKYVSLLIGTLATAAGGVVIGTSIYKGYIHGCPNVDPSVTVGTNSN